jgi:hypothetical protein
MAALDIDAPYQIKAVSAAYTMTDQDIAVVATAGSAYAVTLPPLAGVPVGHMIIIAKDGGANAITVTPNASEKINNIAATLALASGGTNGHSVTLISASTTWLVVGAN